MINGIIKGDTIVLECSVQADISSWKIRAEIWDANTHKIRLATSNITGGSDDQIEVTSTSAEQSEFLIKIASGETTDFNDNAKIEIEIDTGNVIAGQPEIKTIFKGDIDFNKERITWLLPSDE